MVFSLPSSFNARRPGPPALIVVGVDWCGYCQSLKPVLRNVETDLSGVGIKVYWVDGDVDANAGRMREWQVDGFPTILYKTSDNRFLRYPDNAPRTANGIKRFIARVDAEALSL
jgi:thiol-disulfide isomerase/thioredoxin